MDSGLETKSPLATRTTRSHSSLHRIPLNSKSSFLPDPSEIGHPPCFGEDGSPVYLGSAVFQLSVHPCKITTYWPKPRALVSYQGKEVTHDGRYELLPYNPIEMEFVITSRGLVPPGRRPVQGGYEVDGSELYHAVVIVNGLRVPGKAGLHLRGARVGIRGEEHVITENYEILCWLPPPPGHRIQLNTKSSSFPNVSQLGPPPFFEEDGTPVYFGSAPLSCSLQPCKIVERVGARALVPYRGKEVVYEAKCDLLPFDPQFMELITTSHGLIPPGRRPVEGGYEEDGSNLYHAVAMVNGSRVPGKTGEHLQGARIGFEGKEHIFTEKYEILCWLPPPSGHRIQLHSTSSFPDASEIGEPPCSDSDGLPLYFGSAFLPRSLHPCRLGRHLRSHVLVPYGGEELAHEGWYELLPFLPQSMELVTASYGLIPYGRRPVEGGYEEYGLKLYHAVATVNGVRVPGKTGEHLGGANIGYGGTEHVKRNYQILCWR